MATKKQTKKGKKMSKVDQELYEKHFRVAIFGSARAAVGDDVCDNVEKLAEKIGVKGWDIVTGGGPGLMEAANKGHQMGSEIASKNGTKNGDSIGLTIRLPWEAHANRHLDIKKHFDKFSGRLDTFMFLSNVVVVAPGGIGTALELFYTWQLIQVRHICPMAIIVLGDQWEELINWVKKYPLERGLISEEDMNYIYPAKTPEEEFRIVEKSHKMYEKLGDDACINANMYKL